MTSIVTQTTGRRHPASVGQVRRQVRLNLWIPLTPILVLLSPLAVLSLPLVEAFILARRIDPRAVGAILRTVLALSGTDIAIDSPRAHVRVRIF